MISRVERTAVQLACTADEAQLYLDLRDEGYSSYQAKLMAGLADPADPDLSSQVTVENVNELDVTALLTPTARYYITAGLYDEDFKQITYFESWREDASGDNAYVREHYEWSSVRDTVTGRVVYAHGSMYDSAYRAAQAAHCNEVADPLDLDVTPEEDEAFNSMRGELR